MEEDLIKKENEIKKVKKDYGKVIRIRDRELADMIKSLDEKELRLLLERYIFKKKFKMSIFKIFKGEKDGE